MSSSSLFRSVYRIGKVFTPVGGACCGAWLKPGGDGSRSKAGRRGKELNLLPLPCAGSALPMSYAPSGLSDLNPNLRTRLGGRGLLPEYGVAIRGRIFSRLPPFISGQFEFKYGLTLPASHAVRP